MAKYFANFPKIDYDLDSTELQYVTNITSRFGLDQNLKENSALYYTYNVDDGDTPEILASKIYDSPEKHWVILMMNDIVDPQFDWVLSYDQFNQYLEEKYSQPDYANTANTNVSGLSWTQNINNVQTYYKVVTKQIGDNINIEKFEVDANTYANNTIMGINRADGDTYTLRDGSRVNIKITKTTQTYYDYEQTLNENKRTIKLLKSEFVPYLEEELARVFE
jgi:hypothetical protein